MARTRFSTDPIAAALRLVRSRPGSVVQIRMAGRDLTEPEAETEAGYHGDD